MLAFIGSRTTRERNARGVGLSVYEVMEGGPWRLLQTVDLINPSYLLVDPDRRTLYTVHGDMSDISAFAIGDDGRLKLLNRRSTRGRNPVHLAFAPRRSHVIVANYATGSLSSLPIAANGALAEVSSTLALEGTPGPRSADQTGPHPHQVLAWPGTDLLLVPDKGLDRLHGIRVDNEGALFPAWAMLANPGAGCRHAVLDPERGWLWVVNELDVSVTQCRVDVQAGRVERLRTVGLVPDGSAGGSTAAGIVRRADMLYVSVRGLDAVIVLRIDPADGSPTVLQTVATGGRTPRFISLSPGGQDLWVAHEGSDDVARLPISADGLLLAPQTLIQTGSPVCIAFLDL